MKVIIAGGSGFIGTALGNLLEQAGHEVFVLTRRNPRHARHIQWDGRTTRGWGDRMSDMNAIVNLTGLGLNRWPWTKRQKQKFLDSRIIPGRALVAAVEAASPRPKVFLQMSGINHYGLRGEGIVDETTPAGSDFQAQLTVQWEAATRPVKEAGVRHVVARSGVVLARKGGLFPLMALPVRLFFGGRLGDGTQGMPWIHLADEIHGLKFLLEKENSRGVYNLVSPQPTSNAEFLRAVAHALHRPFWFHVPKFLLRLFLGEMSTMVTEGRHAKPGRLLEEGYEFRFPTLEGALEDIYSK